ncbi:unnamed protein product [Candida verbasci]|uniref:PH-response regulator protein palH/RIM21 n=1 Tax=Candida verbasci TaxID=1227364 RepID=A0A9W4TTE8_9ASCO|nr:unnamed protein product [Candida verbasci]
MLNILYSLLSLLLISLRYNLILLVPFTFAAFAYSPSPPPSSSSSSSPLSSAPRLEEYSVKFRTPPVDIDMGNNSLAYLQQNNLEINCSVYSLTSGSINIQDFYNQTWYNDTDNDFLPAYYITNCSIPHLIDLVMENELNGTSGSDLEDFSEFDQSPYNERDNGDTFVALLFTLCGSCVSCWMLSLLLYLSPSHKRKPLLTQLVTIYFSIVTTFCLNKVTQTAEEEYYNDTLDVIKLHHLLYNTTTYKVLIIITQVLTMSAWFQFIQGLMKQRGKFLLSFITSIIMCLYIAVFTYHQVVYNTSEYIHLNSHDGSTLAWCILRAVTRLLVIIWLSLNLLWYTIMIKNPLTTSYSKKLLPLAIFNWCLLILDIILNILHITLFKDNWLVKTWLILLPYLIEVILTTTLWEWIFNISILEKRSELMGILGRRISIDDILDIQSNDERRRRKIVSFKNRSDHKIFGWLINLFGLKTNNILQEDGSEEDELKELISSTNDSSTFARQTESSRIESNNSQVHQVAIISPNTPEVPQVYQTNNDLGDHINEEEFDDEYIDNYDIWGDDRESTTSNTRHLT